MEFRMLNAKGLSCPVVTGAEVFAAGKLKRGPLSEEGAGEYREALELLRWAPSAVNKQPWRVVRQETGFHFYKKRSLPVTDRGDVQKLDIGIALAHFVLALEEQGISGTVTAADPSLKNDEDVEYIVSWCKS